MNNTGLKQRIRVAASAEQILDLLKEGKTYKMASDKTRRAWKYVGARRAATLAGEKPPAPVVQEVVEVDAKPKAKRKPKKKMEE